MTADYLYWIRGQDCVVPGCARQGEAHHVKSKGAGGGDEGNTVPICHIHHMAGHTSGWSTMQARWGVDLRLKAQAYEQRWNGKGQPTMAREG